MIVLKILLWIVLAVLAVILLFLVIPMSVEIAYIDKKITYKIAYGFVSLYGSDKKGIAGKFIEKRKKKKDDTDDFADFDDNIDKAFEDDIEEVLLPETDEIYNNDVKDDIVESTDNTEKNVRKKDKPEEKKSEHEGKIDKLIEKIDRYEDKIEKVLDVLRSADRPFVHICKGFKFSGVYIDFMVTGEDAYKCAMNYGKISGAVYNLLGWISTVCTANFRTVDVFPDFNAKESRWDVSTKLSFRLITPIVAGIQFLITYIFKFFIPQKRYEKKLKKSRK